MHPLIGVLAVGMSDPRLSVGIGLLVLTLALVRARALLRQPQRPQRARRGSLADRIRDRAGRAPN